jgi:hypothetical protein
MVGDRERKRLVQIGTKYVLPATNGLDGPRAVSRRRKKIRRGAWQIAEMAPFSP